MATMNFNSDTLFSAVKRKNVKDILVYVLNEAGETKAAEVMATKNRITDLAITEVREAMVGIERDGSDTDGMEVVDMVETTTDATDLTYADADLENLQTVGEIKALVATGKKKNIKKAKDAFKAQFDKKHPDYKELKKLFKKDK